MVVVSMPWSEEDDKRFRSLLAGLLGMTLLLSVVIPLIPLPEIAREVQEQFPAHLAEIVLPKPEPKPVQPTPEVPVEPEPDIPNEPREVVEEQIVAPARQTVQQAREKAKASGILAFQDDLNDLREAVDASALAETASVQRGAGEAASLDRALLTSKSGTRLANVNVAALSRETGGVALAGRETTIVEAPEDETARAGAVRTARPEAVAVRSIEEVRRVFDTNKGAIYAIYNRALRSNPTLLGKVVLELVIQPDGSVSECKVVTSELNDDEVIARITRRVQLFDFGEKDVAVTRISYPVHFLPT